MEKMILTAARLEKLEEMLDSGEMKKFMLACNELAAREEREAYELMKRYITHKDKFRRLYVFKTIFRHPAAAELIPWLEKSIASGEEYFCIIGLKTVGELGIKINREILISAVENSLSDGYYDVLSALCTLEASEGNYRAILGIFENAPKSGQKEALAEILCGKYLPEKAEALFGLFAASDFAKVRVTAAKIGRKYGFDLEKLRYDENGHVRKIAGKDLC